MVLLKVVLLALMLMISQSVAKAQIISLDMTTFQIEYDCALRIPVHVSWKLALADLGQGRREPSWKFTEDTRVPTPRARHQDYTNSGYDRGHMCPAADRSASRSAMRSTFVMTNVCPQSPSLNRGEWKKLEEACRKYVRSGQYLEISAHAVFVTADTARIGAANVAVPHAFVKNVFLAGTDSIIYSKWFNNGN